MRHTESSILSFSTLFPSPVRPLHGLFVERRLLALSRLVPLRVIAPVNVARSPRALWTHLGTRSPGGLAVAYPRFLLPRPGFRARDGAFLFAEVWAQIRGHVSPETCRLVDAHYAYPDGAAAARLARAVGRPYVLTVRGSDLEVLAEDPARLPEIRTTVRGAVAVIAVSESLARKARALGAASDAVHVIPNGVDTDRFLPMDRPTACRAIGADPDERHVLFVGSLAPVKGVRLLVEAMDVLRRRGTGRLRCWIVGSGQEREALEALARDRDLAGVVRFVGSVGPDALVSYYAAADLLCLTSRSEGCPNVVLEALACGTPVVAAAVGGVPEIVREGVNGFLFSERTAADLADALGRSLAREWDAGALRRTVAERTWATAAREHARVLEQAVHGS